jgi:two-component sensor histidine kinase
MLSEMVPAGQSILMSTTGHFQRRMINKLLSQETILPSENLNLPVWDAEQLRLAITAAGVALWSWNVDTNRFTMDERAFDLWGVPLSEYVTFDDLSSHIHPADRDRVKAAFAATRAIIGAYEIDFRILVGEEVRWISARGQGSDAGIVGRIMFGIFIDVTGRKQAEEGHELLAGEMSHRVKNLLAIASGLTAITSRSAKTTADMAKELTQRLTALGRAHDLVRPLPGQSGKAALLGDLLTVLLAPYDDMGAFSGRVRVSVPRMGVGELAATTLALVIHELATNSLKYGALSSPTGTLDISCAPHDTEVVVVWTERGGPPVVALTGDGGYGSKLINRAMTVQLGGSISCDWSAEGVIVTLHMTKDRLTK